MVCVGITAGNRAIKRNITISKRFMVAAPSVPELCGGLPILNLLAPLRGGEIPRLTQYGVSGVSHGNERTQNRCQLDEKAPFSLFLSVPHPPSLRQAFFHHSVTQTQRGSIQPRERLKPHELATSCRDKRLSLRP